MAAAAPAAALCQARWMTVWPGLAVRRRLVVVGGLASVAVPPGRMCRPVTALLVLVGRRPLVVVGGRASVAAPECRLAMACRALGRPSRSVVVGGPVVRSAVAVWLARRSHPATESRVVAGRLVVVASAVRTWRPVRAARRSAGAGDRAAGAQWPARICRWVAARPFPGVRRRPAVVAGRVAAAARRFRTVPQRVDARQAAVVRPARMLPSTVAPDDPQARGAGSAVTLPAQRACHRGGGPRRKALPTRPPGRAAGTAAPAR
ncbi:hypothetical protein AB0J74_25155 [Asanoa sp. NPDC049573]|uniref:hypothetical protein n=1 Tax=Asanoa sp. NPDC049573 TaxID=3155396 RepID=UPI00342415EB